MKTYLQDFLEKYPNAMLDREGLPVICPYQLGYYGKPICEEVKERSLNCFIYLLYLFLRWVYFRFVTLSQFPHPPLSDFYTCEIHTIYN